MISLVERRPLGFTAALIAVMIAVGILSKAVVAPLVPWLTTAGIGLVLNWLFVVISVALVAWLGWWGKIRLFAPVDRRALVYMLPFVGMVALPVVFGMAIQEVSIVAGQPLPDWASVLYIVVGIALGAAVFEELLFRGVLLRALEPRGRLFAGVVTAVAFASTHLSQIVLGGTWFEWAVTMLLIVPAYVGIAAVTFRMGSLWPVVVYHFAVDVTFLHAASQPPAFIALLLGLTVVAGVMGVWLLRQDDRAARAIDASDAEYDVANPEAA